MVKNQGTKQRVQRILGDCWQWETDGQCVKGDNCSFRHDINKRGKSSPSNPSPNSFMQQNERKTSRTRSPRRVPVVESLDCRARMTSKELAPLHSVKSGILQNACSTSQKMDADLGKQCSYAHRQFEEQPSKRSNKNGDKSAVVMLKITRQLGCVFQDMEPPKSSSILRKSSNILKPVRCVRFTKAVLRHANIRDKIHRLE